MPILRTIAQAAVVCLLVIDAPLALAQQPADRTKPCVPDKGVRYQVDQAFQDLFATLVPAGDSGQAPGMYLGTLLQEVRLRFDAPDTIAELSHGEMHMWLHADGRLTNVRAADTVLSAELLRTLGVAIDSTSRAGGIGPVFPRLAADSVPLRLIVHFADQRTPLSVPLLRVSPAPAYLEFQVEKPALSRPGSFVPRYPEHLREMNVEGEVLVQFVVNQAGRAEMRTFRVLKSSDREFTAAVREVLPHMRFSPAELGGCTVRQLVQLPFDFKLRR